jgi:hypothetical protein
MGLGTLLLLFGLGLLLLAVELDDRMRRRRQKERSQRGVGLDSGRLAPRVSVVRQDYTIELRSHWREAQLHEQLLAARRQALLELPFFQARLTTGGKADHPAASV